MEKEPKFFEWSPDIINICLDTRDNFTGTGRVYHLYDTEPIRFGSFLEMLLEIDKLFDKINFPQASFKPRSFFDKPYVIPALEEAESVWDREEVLKQMGDKASFVVNVQYRENATWQGTVMWVEENRKKPFRSAMELLKLMEEALDKSEEKK